MRRNWDVPRGEVRHLEIESQALAGNLLGDQSHRALPVYLPPGYRPEDRLPLLVDLVGITGTGTFSPKFFQLTWDWPEPVKPTRSTSSGR